jgi:hypothetical protein
MTDDAQLDAALSSALESLGFRPNDSGVRGVVPAVLHGGGAVLAVPPAPGYAGPALAAAIARALAPEPGFALALVAEPSLEAWASVAGRLGRAVDRRAVVVSSAARVARFAPAADTAAVVVPLPIGVEAARRSALPMERIRAVLVAWPENLAVENLVPLFQDLPKECPRVLLTADPDGQAGLIERYAWRAPMVGPLATPRRTAPVAPRLRVATVPWAGRIAALGRLAEMADSRSAAIWTADTSQHEAIREILLGRGVDARFAASPAGEADLVVAFDPPPPDGLGEWASRDAVVLMPPGTEAYLRRWGGTLHPVALPGPLEQARDALAAERRTIQERIDAGDDRAALLALGPLLESNPPTLVAAALYDLWARAGRLAAAGREAARERPRDQDGHRSRVWVSAGTRDGATTGAWLGFLTHDLEIPREELGRVDPRETFTLIEFRRPGEAERAVERLAGRVFRGRRLSARVDRGPGGRRTPRPGAA